MNLYDPRGMTWEQWCKLQCEQHATLGLVPAPEENWRDWVVQLFRFGGFAAQGVPDARGFRTWQDWACQYLGVMQNKTVTS